MSEDEILDQVDETGKVIGRAPRSEFHRNPEIIHRTVHCWVFNPRGQILMQQRSRKKVHFPGYWDMSCGGHVEAGQTPMAAIRRELKEELGLVSIKPKYVEKYIDPWEDETELVYLYYAVCDWPIKNFIIEKSEVTKIEWTDIARAQELQVDGKRQGTIFIFNKLPRILQKIFVEYINRCPPVSGE